MFNEIEQLENEIIEFRSLVRESSELLMQIDNNTSHIKQLKVDLDNLVDKMHDREVEIAATNHKLRKTMVLAIASVIVGFVSLIISLML